LEVARAGWELSAKLAHSLEAEAAMQTLMRVWIVGLGSLCCSVASAQAVDSDASPRSTGARSSVAAPPASTVHGGGGSSKSILEPFGPYITQTGVGGGGANVSELYTTFTLGAVGYNIFGYGMQHSIGSHVADDFTVTASNTVQNVKWLVYQTGAATTGSITSMNLNLWNTDPEGQLQGGQWATGGNQFQSNSWTGVYRVTDNALTAINRAIIQVTCTGAWIPTLAPGTYWLEASAGGTLTSGPWAPPKTVAGQVPPTGAAWNGLQSASAGAAFARVYDTGNPLGSINEPLDFLFQVEALCFIDCSGLFPFCTSKTSSIGCAPFLTGPTSAKKSGSPAANLTASPVPGGSGLPGILLYSKLAPVAPIATSFGFLCISNFARAGAFPSSPGGTSGTCTGVYTWDMAAIAAGTSTLAVGDQLSLQAWYRDPGFPPPGNANFTQGVWGLNIVP
jgi:hypothetical protein